MFPVLETIAAPWVLCGIIWAVALGFSCGNYACSFIHRLPRGRSILEKKPYCGHCLTPLQVKDLFPVFSALLLRHRCRYCGESYPTSHTWTELLVGVLFVLCFLIFNFSDAFCLLAGLGTFIIVVAAIEVNEKMVLMKVLFGVLVLGALTRTFFDHNITNFFAGGFFGWLAGMALWRAQVVKLNHIYYIPVPARLMAVAGVCAGQDGIVLFFVLFGCFYALAAAFRLNGKLTISWGLAIMLPLLFPAMSLLSLKHYF